ncbi:MAG: hypothetical protein ABI847_11595 [Anaerolineales bacterium]
MVIAAGLAVFYPAAQLDANRAILARVVEAVMVLAFGAQAAFVLAPDSEPPLELLLASPRPPAWAVWERLLALGAVQGGVALAASLASVILTRDTAPAGLGLMLMRWLAPAMFLGGAAVLATQATRQGSFGALLATLLWSSMLFGGDAMLARWPWLWPAHLFLQPQNASSALYAANRAGLLLMGVALMAAAPLLLRDEARALGLAGKSRGA